MVAWAELKLQLAPRSDVQSVRLPSCCRFCNNYDKRKAPSKTNDPTKIMLPIRRRSHFLLDKQPGWKALKIRLRIRYGGGYVTNLFIGHRAEPEKWSVEMERCMKNTTHGDARTPASVINRDLQIVEEVLESAFSYFEEQEHLPTPEELKAKYFDLVGDRLGMVREKPKKGEKTLLLDLWDKFISTESIRKGWSKGYQKTFHSVRASLKEYSPSATIADINQQWIIRFASHLAMHRGLLNSTIDRSLRLLKSFFRWAKKSGYYKKDYEDFFEIRLKGADSNRSAIYLTWEELSRVYTLPIEDRADDVARDLFCFLCFTGMRYGDMQRLKRSDITHESVRFIAQKTDTYIDIPLNDYSRAILDKYSGETFPNGRALPSMWTSPLNAAIKRVCQLAGVDTPITRLRYSGQRRIEETLPKWKLASSHIGRHTFVVSALTLGIPSEVIRKYTGHKTEATMRPYIAIADELKTQEMAKFNRPLVQAKVDAE